MDQGKIDELALLAQLAAVQFGQDFLEAVGGGGPARTPGLEEFRDIATTATSKLVMPLVALRDDDALLAGAWVMVYSAFLVLLDLQHAHVKLDREVLAASRN